MKRVDTDTDDSGRGSSTLASSSVIINSGPLHKGSIEAAFPPDAPEETFDYALPLPPDGGYGWVIVGACFLIFAVLDGMSGVLGLFLPHILAEFNTSRALVSLSGAIYVGVLLAIGPLVGVSINLFTCRTVSMVGGIVVSFACFFSSFSTSMETFITLYGVVMGIGAGMIYIPISVMPGYYFEQKRGIANGIACSGSGVGMVMMPLLTATLLKYYNWRTVMIILAGVILQTVVLGALLRPLTWIQSYPDASSSLASEQDDMEGKDTNEAIERLMGKRASKRSLQFQRTDTEGIFSMGYSRYVLGSREIPRMKEVQQGAYHPAVDPQDIGENARQHTITQSCQVLPTSITGQNKNRLLKFPNPAVQNVRTSDVIKHVDITKWAGVQPFNVREIENEGDMDTVLTSCYEMREIKQIANMELPRKGLVVDRKRVRFELLQTFARQDAFYAGSIKTLKEYKSFQNRTSYITSVTNVPMYNDDNPTKCCGVTISSHAVMTAKDMLHLSILLDPCFVIIALSGIAMIFGYYVPIYFMADHTSSLNISPTGAASLIAIFGVANSVGRVLSGALASSGWVDPLHIHAWSMVSAGVCCCLMVTVCSTYIPLAIVVGTYGLSIGMFVPLSTVFLVKYIGLSKLTNAYGFFSMMKGLFGLAGPTVSGSMIDRTGTFTSAYFFGAGMLIVSGLLIYLLPLANRWKKSRNIDIESD